MKLILYQVWRKPRNIDVARNTFVAKPRNTIYARNIRNRCNI